MPRMTAPSPPDKPKRASTAAAATAAAATAGMGASLSPSRGHHRLSRAKSPSRSPRSQSSPHPRPRESASAVATTTTTTRTTGERGGAVVGTEPTTVSSSAKGSTSAGAGRGGGGRGKLRARAPKIGAERAEVDRALHEAREVRSSIQEDLLTRHLRESRDAVLSGKNWGAATGKGRNRVFPRLPSNGSTPFRPPDFSSPAATFAARRPQGDALTRDNSFSGPAVTVRIRTSSLKPNAVQTTVVLSPPLYLQGAPSPPLPPSSATVFLRALVSSEDEQHLTHVPYFGDDDGEDVVSEYYDMEKREKMMSAGPEYRAREVCALMDRTVGILRERYGSGGGVGVGVGVGGGGEEFGGDVIEEVQRILAEELDVDVERVAKSWAAAATSVGKKSSHTHHSSPSSSLLSKANSNSKSNANVGGSWGGGKNDGNANTEDGGGDGDANGGDDVNNNDASPSTKTATKNSSADRPIEYEHLMDSYRNLFCRRCFTYDCNMHGNITKADASLQGELAVVKEDMGYWDDVDFPLPRVVTTTVADEDDDDGKDGERRGGGNNGDGKAGNGDDGARNGAEGVVRKTTSSPPARNGGGGAPKRPANDGGDERLTPLQKSLCERLHLMFRGDVARMARVAGADRDAVASYVREMGIESKPFVHVEHQPRPDRRGSNASPPPDGTGGTGGGGVKKRRVGGGQPKAAALGVSMKNYNAAWLKRVEGAEIHPLFIPCDHSGPCSEETCSCVKNAAFCTKHCVWGPRSRNFFRGCACKAGRCQTKSCACFAARIECDPDLCRSCGACTDEPNRPATVQRCRNDNIGMRRHCHLLLAPSGIENAGWGIFTKHALKRGDFVHEYVGEVISQEEAERRGRIYDKNNRSYLFNLSSDFVVDASRKGNKTKFANHSSRPNCYTKLVSVNGTARIGLFAQEDIEPQSELFFDYRYDVGMDNDLLHKPGMTVDWMKNPKMANQISKKNP